MGLKYCQYLFLLFLFAASSPMAAAVNVNAQVPDAVILSALQGSAKLMKAEEVLADFNAGKTETGVIVILKSSSTASALAAKGQLSADVPAAFRKPCGPPYYNLKDPAVKKQLKATVSETVDKAVNALGATGMKVTQKFIFQFGFAARVTPAALQKILNHPDVIGVAKDRILKAHLQQGIPLMKATAPRSTYTGSGMGIAICDTGVDTSHPMLGGTGNPSDPIFNTKVIGGYDTGDNDADPRPNSISGEAHGTACAGIAAGDIGTVGDYIGGVAPDAKIYALKISTGDTGNATGAAMLAAWEWATDNQTLVDPSNPIMIISTSFGGGSFGDPLECDWFDYPSTTIPDAMAVAAANANAVGITIFASSGNDGFCSSMGWPACISSVNSVGAVYDASLDGYGFCVDSTSCTGVVDANYCVPPAKIAWESVTGGTYADKVTVYSNSASFLTLFAPSHDAYTTDIVGTGGYNNGVNQPGVNQDYDSSFGGTSAACPYAAGAAAVLQSAAKAVNGTFLTPSEVQQYLVTNGDNVTDSKVAVTKSRVNLGNAVDDLFHQLTVTRKGNGTVTSDIAGINCGTDCMEIYYLGEAVTLTATPVAGVPFLGWSGEGCSGTGTCTVTMDQDRNVTANFYAFSWPMFIPAFTTQTPAAYWGALSTLYCEMSAATFSLTSSGVTKKSVCQAGTCAGGSGTFEGWVTTTPGSKLFSWSLSASTCGTLTGGYNYTLVDGQSYLFSMELNASSQPAIYVYVGTGKPQGASFGVRMLDGIESSVELNGTWEIIDEIPLDIPKGIFASSQKRLTVIEK